MTASTDVGRTIAIGTAASGGVGLVLGLFYMNPAVAAAVFGSVIGMAVALGVFLSADGSKKNCVK